jgi:hypothetical protein
VLTDNVPDAYDVVVNDGKPLVNKFDAYIAPEPVELNMETVLFVPTVRTGSVTLNSVELVNVTLAVATCVPPTNTLEPEENPVPIILINELLVPTAVSSKLFQPLSVTIIEVIVGPVVAPELIDFIELVDI